MRYLTVKKCFVKVKIVVFFELFLQKILKSANFGGILEILQILVFRNQTKLHGK